jgi:hypothetical protein
MKYKSLAVALVFFLLITGVAACLQVNTVRVEETPDTQKENMYPNNEKCGDGVCRGPENAQNCPEDCQPEAHIESPVPSEVSTSENEPASGKTSPLYVGISVHLEGWKLGNEKLGYNLTAYEKYTENILNYSAMANAYEMPFTWETANLIEPSAALETNVLLELYQRGDGVGIHADLGGKTPYPGGEAKFTQDLKKYRQQMENIGILVKHASGVCSTLDWVTAALDAGYIAVTGTVEYCLKSLPDYKQDEEILACGGPALCHDPYPGELPDMLHPWQAADGHSWTTPAEEGLIIFGTAGSLPCSTEPGSSPKCDLQIIEDALAARQPGKFHSLFFVWSYGSALEEEVLKTFYEGLQPYLESGEVVWKTMPELIKSYQKFEESDP